jgi:hypothetical protein
LIEIVDLSEEKLEKKKKKKIDKKIEKKKNSPNSLAPIQQRRTAVNPNGTISCAKRASMT